MPWPPRKPEPPRLEVLKDIRIAAPDGLEGELRFFYGKILGLPEEPSEGTPRERLCFSGREYRLVVEAAEMLPPPEMRRRAVLAVGSLPDIAELLEEHKIGYKRETGLSLSDRRLHVTDPAGNRLELRQTWPF
jgi:hypothetical protein